MEILNSIFRIITAVTQKLISKSMEHQSQHFSTESESFSQHVCRVVVVNPMYTNTLRAAC